MYKFAHLADCHIGGQKYPQLKKLEILSFKKCIETCIKENVDFIIIAGDLFHSNLPDMGIVKEVVRILKKVNDKGISVYINYGSHDFSPTGSSVIDIITAAGLLKKVFLPDVIEDENGKENLLLNFVVDSKTNAKICGIPGRKIGLEKEYFDDLYIENLEKEEGFKIFVFHTAIKNLIDEFLLKRHENNIDISFFPKGFDYYAGGHVHEKKCEKLKDYGTIVYPGTLFAGYPKDLEISARGKTKRGFYIIEFDKKICKINFHELKLVKYHIPLIFKADNKNSHQLFNEIMETIERIEFDREIVIIKVKGQLAGGKTSDLDFNKINQFTKEKGALYVGINYHNLTSAEFKNKLKKGDSISEIERNLLHENLSNIEVNSSKLKGKKGLDLALNLLDIFRQNPKLNEKKSEYSNRIAKDVLKLLDL